MTYSYDATIVGAGPNGLAAAITLAQAGRRVVLIEANQHIGGALSSAELTLPGFIHDRGSAVHPLGLGSPFLRTLPLERYGLQWIFSPSPLAHPLDGGNAVVLQRSVAATAAELGIDQKAYQRLIAPLARHWETLTDVLLSPLIPPPLWPPKRLAALAGFGPLALMPASWLAKYFFPWNAGTGTLCWAGWPFGTAIRCTCQCFVWLGAWHAGPWCWMALPPRWCAKVGRCVSRLFP